MPTDEHSTPIAGQAVSAQSRETYPSIQKLFSHTLAPEPFDAEDNYGGWESEQLGRPRFFLTGVKQLSSFLHTYEMKKYFELRDEAKALLMQRPEWTLVAPGILEPIAENQFNRAKNEDAITFERAVVIIAAFEVRYARRSRPLSSHEWIFCSRSASPRTLARSSSTCVAFDQLPTIRLQSCRWRRCITRT